MSRSLHTAASCVLLAVLSGAPAVAVICAELCTPEMHAAQADHAAPHGAPTDEVPAVPETGAMTDCHRAPATGGTIQSYGPARCVGFSSGTVPSLTAGRTSPAPLPAIEAVRPVLVVSSPVRSRTGFDPTGFRPPRPPAASLVLRI